MGDTTAIGWTNATWNPWQGCTKVSEGCDNCYMFRDKTRYGQNPKIVVRSKTTFKAPLKWKEPALVFTCSWSDWFHKTADPWRDEAWQIVKDTPHLTYQILTKRPGRIARHLPTDWGDGYPNVWLGVSVEAEQTAHRIAVLRDTPARVRFLSAEPLIGPLDLDRRLNGIHWVIVGGESGPACRPMDLAWARNIREECKAQGAAFFLKQLGGNPDARAHYKAVLDGQTYTEFPAASAGREAP